MINPGNAKAAQGGAAEGGNVRSGTDTLYSQNEFPQKENQPNAWLVKNSRFMKREERDFRLYLSPSHDDYLFPKIETDLFDRLNPQYLLEEVFDSHANEPIEIRDLTTKLSRREKEMAEKMALLISACAAAGRNIEEARFATDKELRDLFDRCTALSDEIKNLKDQISHRRNYKLESLKRKPRLVSFSHQELIEKQIPERKFILKPWLPEAAISMVYAPPGVGKSYLCLSAAGTIASGGTLFKTSPWEAPEPKRVLYVDGEMHEADLQMRIKKLFNDLGKNIPDNHLRYINGSWQSEFIPDLSNPEGQALIEEVIVDQGTKVLFLDNLSTLCRSGRENETDSWKQMQTWLLQLRWRGIAVVLVHHAGKGKDENGKPRQRGTSMREVILESSIVLDHPKDYSEEMGCLFELSYVKARGFYGADAVPLEVKLDEKNGMFSWLDKKLSVKTYDTIVDMHGEGTTSVKEIASELGISAQAVRKHIRQAKKKGDIK